MTSHTIGPQRYLLPQSTAGRWSAGLLALSIAAFAFTFVMVGLGQTGGETFTDNLLLSVPVGIAALAAVTSAIAGLVAVFRDGERSLVVFAGIAWGALVAAFFTGELTNPH